MLEDDDDDDVDSLLNNTVWDSIAINTLCNVDIIVDYFSFLRLYFVVYLVVQFYYIALLFRNSIPNRLCLDVQLHSLVVRLWDPVYICPRYRTFKQPNNTVATSFSSWHANFLGSSLMDNELGLTFVCLFVYSYPIFLIISFMCLCVFCNINALRIAFKR